MTMCNYLQLTDKIYHYQFYNSGIYIAKNPVIQNVSRYKGERYIEIYCNTLDEPIYWGVFFKAI